MSYAARHPDLFVAAGAFSGAVETTADPQAQRADDADHPGDHDVGLNGEDDPDAIFGPRATQNVNWARPRPGDARREPARQGHAPVHRQRHAGPARPGPPEPGGAAIEGGVHQLNELFHGRLEALQHPVTSTTTTARARTPGPTGRATCATSCRCWRRSSLIRRAAPARVAYRSGDARWSAWGYDVEMQRPAREFSGWPTATPAASSSPAAAPRWSARRPSTAPGRKATVTTRTASAERQRHARPPTRPAACASRCRWARATPTSSTPPPRIAKGGPEVFTTRVTIDGVARPPSCTLRRTTLKFPVAVGTRLRRVRVTIDGRRRLGARRRGRFVSVPLKGLAPGSHRVVVNGRASTSRRTLGRAVTAGRVVSCG